MTNDERRIIELQFYVAIQLLYSIKPDADFLVQMLEGLRFLVPFNIETVIAYANNFNLDILWQPYQGEVVGVLYTKSKIPMNALCKAMGISRPTGYKLVEEYLKEPYISQPKVTDQDIIELNNMVKAYNILRKEFKSNG